MALEKPDAMLTTYLATLAMKVINDAEKDPVQNIAPKGPKIGEIEQMRINEEKDYLRKETDYKELTKN